MSSATLRSSLSPAICEQATSRSCSVASTLRENTTSPASSSTLTQWKVLPTSKPTQNVILPCLLSCIATSPYAVLALHRIPLASLTLQSDSFFADPDQWSLRDPKDEPGGLTPAAVCYAAVKIEPSP